MTVSPEYNARYIDNGTTIDTLRAMAGAQDAEKEDFRARSGQLYVDNETGLLQTRENEVVKDLDGSPYTPTPLNLTKTAVGHMAGKLGIYHGNAFLTGNEGLPVNITADTLNHFIGQEPDKEWLVRTYGANARAALSNRYLIMDHLWALDLVKYFLTNNGQYGEPVPHLIMSGWRLEPDYMNFKLLVSETEPDGGSDGSYGFGVQVTNGEVGNASLAAAELILRTSCFNSTTYRNKDWRVMHSGNADKDSMALRESRFLEYVGKALRQSTELIERMVRSRQQRLPSVVDVMAEIVEQQGFPEEVLNYAMIGTENNNSLFGLANGLTYGAGNTPDLNPDIREDMEAFAGSMLNQFAPLNDKEAAKVSSGDALARKLFKFAGSKVHLEALKDGAS